MKGFWASARTLPRDEPDAMCHTDLIPGNLLVTDGRLAGVLDTGGFQAADPALDLVCAWHLLDDGPREVLRRSLDCSELQWQRGRAWAFEQAAGAYWYYVDTNPTMAAMGRTTLERLAASF
jgi:aminoglycoside phosphotransferase (APT) family kinase protein